MDKQLLSNLEGLIFMVGEDGVDLKTLTSTLEVEENIIVDYLKVLTSNYQAEHHGIELVNYGGLYKFVSKESIYEYGKKMFTTTKESKLSQSALETLAIIAYKQPITRIEIEEIRGVSADTMLKRLMIRGLIKEVGRAETVGMPILYGVTEKFLDTFKLLSIDELPDLPNYSGQMEMDLYE